MITSELLDAARREATEAARHLTLPFGRQAWHGQQGNWLGCGLGSSIDFQDHRAYMPGDDPRYIHWSAYARTGQLTMKLYRAENTPLVDLVVDVSASMLEDPEKARCTAALLSFCVASADAGAAPVRLRFADGRQLREVPADLVRGARWQGLLPKTESTVAAPGPLTWRASGLKVLISDLLFPGDPESVLGSMGAGTGFGLILRPWLHAETLFEERGNIELVDVESGQKRQQRLTDDIADRYEASYRRHQDLWSQACRRRGVLCCPVEGGPTLKESLSLSALRLGAVTLHS